MGGKSWYFLFLGVMMTNPRGETGPSRRHRKGRTMFPLCYPMVSQLSRRRVKTTKKKEKQHQNDNSGAGEAGVSEREGKGLRSTAGALRNWLKKRT